MTRGLIHSVLLAAAAVSAVGHLRASGASNPSAVKLPVLQRFLALDDPTPTQYRALRHLDARNDRFDSSAWMDVWTEADTTHGFRFHVIAEGGDSLVSSRVFVPTLEAEQDLWASGAPDRAGFTLDNYSFEDRGAQPDGLASLAVRPRRKDFLLVEGSIFLRPDDGELMRLEGRLTKTPSFWTRDVEIVRRYQRFAGVRMPVTLDSVASVFIAGRSTLRMTYEYETVNGQRVGTPQPRPIS